MPVRTTRTKKAAETPVSEDAGASEVSSVSPVKTTAKVDPFATLLKNFYDLQSEFESLQKEITQTKQSWSDEQKTHVKEIEDRNTQDELERKRTKESYEYETARKQKIEEDEFADKKANWEKELKDQQEILEKEKAVSQAQEILRKDLTFKFETERKSREQEIKAEKDILNLRITNFTAENNRLNAEIEVLKKSLEEATRQVKEIAVKVIESGTKSS